MTRPAGCCWPAWLAEPYPLIRTRPRTYDTRPRTYDTRPRTYDTRSGTYDSRSGSAKFGELPEVSAHIIAG